MIQFNLLQLPAKKQKRTFCRKSAWYPLISVLDHDKSPLWTYFFGPCVPYNSIFDRRAWVSSCKSLRVFFLSSHSKYVLLTIRPGRKYHPIRRVVESARKGKEVGKILGRKKRQYNFFVLCSLLVRSVFYFFLYCRIKTTQKQFFQGFLWLFNGLNPTGVEGCNQNRCFSSDWEF